MNNITIEVWDATGNKKQLVELPADAAVNRVIAVLVEKMNLPRRSPDGQLMSYKFQHRSSGRQLLDEETLASAKVSNGDIVSLAARNHGRRRPDVRMTPLRSDSGAGLLEDRRSGRRRPLLAAGA